MPPLVAAPCCQELRVHKCHVLICHEPRLNINLDSIIFIDYKSILFMKFHLFYKILP